MTRPAQLLGSFWTLAVGADPTASRLLHDFRLRVETAGEAGFTAMGFWHTDLREIRENTVLGDEAHSGRPWIARSSWNGCWTGSARISAEWSRMRPAPCCSTPPKRSARITSKSATSATIAPTLSAMTEEFGPLCRQAKERGTNVLFEMLPAAFSRAPSLDRVLAICSGSGAENGGIMLDNLHLQRTGNIAAGHRDKRSASGSAGR